MVGVQSWIHFVFDVDGVCELSSCGGYGCVGTECGRLIGLWLEEVPEQVVEDELREWLLPRVELLEVSDELGECLWLR